MLHPGRAAARTLRRSMPQGRARRARRGVGLRQGHARRDRSWLPRPLTTLGTDGFGRSETRAALRNFFEVDCRYVVVATLGALAREGKIAHVRRAAGHYTTHRNRSGEESIRRFVTLRFDVPSFVTDFTLPELGENITSGDVLRILVKPGDRLVKDQPVLELETDKATIEVPSSVAGEVEAVKVKAGDTVKVGQAILSIVETGSAKAPKAASTTSPPNGDARPAATGREAGRPPAAAAADSVSREIAAAGRDRRRSRTNRPARRHSGRRSAKVPRPRGCGRWPRTDAASDESGARNVGARKWWISVGARARQLMPRLRPSSRRRQRRRRFGGWRANLAWTSTT